MWLIEGKSPDPGAIESTRRESMSECWKSARATIKIVGMVKDEKGTQKKNRQEVKGRVR